MKTVIHDDQAAAKMLRIKLQQGYADQHVFVNAVDAEGRVIDRLCEISDKGIHICTNVSAKSGIAVNDLCEPKTRTLFREFN